MAGDESWDRARGSNRIGNICARHKPSYLLRHLSEVRRTGLDSMLQRRGARIKDKRWAAMVRDPGWIECGRPAKDQDQPRSAATGDRRCAGGWGQRAQTW